MEMDWFGVLASLFQREGQAVKQQETFELNEVEAGTEVKEGESDCPLYLLVEMFPNLVSVTRCLCLSTATECQQHDHAGLFVNRTRTFWRICGRR